MHFETTTQWWALALSIMVVFCEESHGGIKPLLFPAYYTTASSILHIPRTTCQTAIYEINPDSMDDEHDSLMRQLEEAEARLKANTEPGSAKWKWPKADVKKVQDLAAKVDAIVSKDLDNLLHWPREPPFPHKEKHHDHELFYAGNFETRFNREKGWFGTMRFKKLETPYTIADNWDRKHILATFLVPNNIVSDEKVPVMWFIHGGGFVSE